MFYSVEFIEYPSNITLPFGTVAVFRCRHSTANGIIWMVNELSEYDFPEDIVPDSIIDHNGTRVFTLTIPARLQYNGTEVVCVAIFLDGPVPRTLSTPPVILTVLAGTLLLCIYCSVPGKYPWVLKHNSGFLACIGAYPG